MTLEDFQKLAETWGGDIERWPEETRASARVVAETPAARLVLARERQLDDFAAQRPAVSRKRAQEAAHAVVLRLAAEAERERVAREKWAAWMPRMPAWLAPTASVACSALLGVVLASSLPYGGLDANQDTLVLSAIFDSGSMAAGLVMR
jgi:hypothetical protein